MSSLEGRLQTDEHIKNRVLSRFKNNTYKQSDETKLKLSEYNKSIGKIPPIKNRFKLGHIPANKGLHIKSNTGRTCFKKGQKSLNKGHIGEGNGNWKGGVSSKINYFKDKRLIDKYGITIEQFEQMKTSQNNKCVICGELFKNNRDTHIDHNHETGKIRQLLCRNCNLGIGFLKDNSILTQKATEYLDKWRVAKSE